MCRSYGGKRGRDMEECRFIDMAVLRIGSVLVVCYGGIRCVLLGICGV